MRRDEARLCRWDWIDETAKMITLPAASTKSQRQRRVPISGRTIAAFRLLPRHLIKPYVLHNTDGDPFASVTINAWFRKIVDRSGVQAAPGDGRVHLHDLRHAYARRNARAGVRIEVISMILGHSTLQQTKDYLQTGDDDIADARETFEESLNGPLRPAQRAKNPDVREDATRSDRESFQP
jgi:integrase